eukprot:TRINITY_DN20550_c0_g1_i2.p1 TRINITY_DN20550_c0_g1~~TRINITY_DN20550_c0_g1_i2.p1  ORF type:complete len:441 (+),score=80.29 TRINITY_DN20550_c0_g1_i2:164-1486(+)
MCTTLAYDPTQSMMLLLPQQQPQDSPVASPDSAFKLGNSRGYGRSGSGSSDTSTTLPTAPATPATPAIPTMPAMSSSPTNEAKLRSSKGPISKLQEFVQSSKAHPLPSSCAVLQWNHENRMAGSQLQFRATTAFLLDGVPHHVQGGWWPSKKQAQRDAAERALCFFVGMCGQQVVSNPDDVLAGFVDRDPAACTTAVEEVELDGKADDHIQVLEYVCGGAFSWKCCWEAQESKSGKALLEGLCRATVEISCLGVPHTFAGKPFSSKAVAMQDAAKRVLWYMNYPGYETAFEVVPEQVKTLAQAIPSPAAGCWPSKQEAGCCSSPIAMSPCSEMGSDFGTPCHSSPQQQTEQAEILERKTTVMRLQNKLQKLFAKQLTPGKSVWCWRYEHNANNGTYQASVEIPLLGRTFTGDWMPTHQAAQMEACTELRAFLEKGADVLV